jgi:hypothetical protein
MVDYSFSNFGRMEVSVASSAAAGGLVGAVQTILLRQYADIPMATSFLKNTSGTPPLLMKQMKGFGSASALAGIIGGAVGLVVGLAGMLKGKLLRSKIGASFAVSYGITALSTGLLSGAFPATAWSAATAADPSNPVALPAITRSVSSNIQPARASGVTLGA